jgi:hypothetical protein
VPEQSIVVLADPVMETKPFVACELFILDPQLAVPLKVSDGSEMLPIGAALSMKF